MYLEDITNGRRFIEIAREITWEARKPMLALKSGRSPEGAQAAASHTGSLAGSDAAYDAIFMQSGIQRVESINELFHYAIAFSRQPVPKGNRVAIVTNAGGPGIMATDAAIRYELELASFSENTTAQLKENLPPTANIHNPVDIIGDADHRRYEAALKAVLNDDNVDGAVVILSPQALNDPLRNSRNRSPTVVQGYRQTGPLLFYGHCRRIPGGALSRNPPYSQLRLSGSRRQVHGGHASNSATCFGWINRHIERVAG